MGVAAGLAGAVRNVGKGTMVNNALASRTRVVILAGGEVVSIAVHGVGVAIFAVVTGSVDSAAVGREADFRAFANRATRKCLAGLHAGGGVCLAKRAGRADGVAISVKGSAFIASVALGAGALPVLAAGVGESGAAGAGIEVSTLLVLVDATGTAEGVGSVERTVVEFVARGAHVTEVGMVLAVVALVAGGTGDAGASEVELGGVAVGGARRANLMAGIIFAGEGIARGPEAARAAGHVVVELVNVVLHDVDADLQTAELALDLGR